MTVASDEMTALRTEVQELRQDMAELTQSVQGLVDAWRTARGVVAFVKWIGVISASVTAMYAAAKAIKSGG